MPVTSSRDWFEKREWDGNQLHYFTIADTICLAAISGLRLEAIHPVGELPGLKRFWPALLCHEISYEFSKNRRGIADTGYIQSKSSSICCRSPLLTKYEIAFYLTNGTIIQEDSWKTKSTPPLSMMKS